MKSIVWKIKEFDELSSTSTELKKVAESEDEGLVYIAKEQEAGKGTKGRSFISLEGGLYMSFLLRPEVSGFEGTGITALTAVAVCEAIEEFFNLEPKIKWVNDILLNSKKVCGILTEGKLGANGFDWVIVGIGVNVSEPKGGFPEEIKGIAGALCESVDHSKILSFAKKILKNVEKYYGEYSSGRYKSGYKSRSAILGKEVSIDVGGETVRGVAVDIDEKNRLVLKCGCTEKVFSSGEVVRVEYDG